MPLAFAMTSTVRSTSATVTRVGAVFGDREGAEGLDDVIQTCGVVGYPCLCVALVLHQHRDYRGKQPRVRARFHP